jgi:hypothetical protein
MVVDALIHATVDVDTMPKTMRPNMSRAREMQHLSLSLSLFFLFNRCFDETLFFFFLFGSSDFGFFFPVKSARNEYSQLDRAPSAHRSHHSGNPQL